MSWDRSREYGNAGTRKFNQPILTDRKAFDATSLSESSAVGRNKSLWTPLRHGMPGMADEKRVRVFLVGITGEISGS